MDIEASPAGETAPSTPPTAAPASAPIPSQPRPKLTIAAFRALVDELTKGPTPHYVEGTFRREDIYGDGEDGR